MLRNPRCKYLLSNLSNQKRLLHQHGVLWSKNAAPSFHLQSKIMGKLYGNRVSGSKKRWFPDSNANADVSSVIFKQSQFGKFKNSGGGKNATRRMTVLNKLFMKHITDLMATGEISESLMGKGLQVSRVKISQEFAYVNVFWLTTGDVGKDIMLEQELQRCTGLLRHELSQLSLMGVVPRIKFVKDKLFTNIGQVETLLRDMDFGAEDEKNENVVDYLEHANDVVKQEFYGNKVMESSQTKSGAKDKDQATIVENLATNLKLPEMRHDVLGLDHKEIMLKLLTKMRKSKQAWEQHQHSSVGTLFEEHITTPNISNVNQPSKLNDKVSKAAENAEKFEEFLAKRRERKNTPERKKYRATDHAIVGAIDESQEHEDILSARQRQFYYAEDYLNEEGDDRKS